MNPCSSNFIQFHTSLPLLPRSDDNGLDDNGKPLRKKAEMDVVEDYDDDYEDYESESSTISHTPPSVQRTDSFSDGFSVISMHNPNIADKNYFFNPPTEKFSAEFCNKWNYRKSILSLKNLHNFANLTQYSFPFGISIGFSNLNAQPIKITSIIGDGNCGYRSLALGLTGSELNHVSMRRDIINFLSDEVKLHRSGVNGHDWWSKICSLIRIQYTYSKLELTFQLTAKRDSNGNMLRDSSGEIVRVFY